MFVLLSQHPTFFQLSMHQGVTEALGELTAAEAHIRELPRSTHDQERQDLLVRVRHVLERSQKLRDRAARYPLVIEAQQAAREVSHFLLLEDYTDVRLTLVNQLTRARLQALQANLVVALTYAQLWDNALSKREVG